MTAPIVELRDVSLVFETGAGPVEALSGIDVSIHSDSATAIVGRSGSGKSSLVAIAGLMRSPSSGEVLIDGGLAPTKERERAAARAGAIGMVFQSFHLDARLTARDNCMLPWYLGIVATSKADAHRRSSQLLDVVGLGPLADRPVHAMSGGERQRTAIARALFVRPRLLIADEPTGNLDEDTAASIRSLLFGLPEALGTAVVVVTHDLEVASGAQRILRIERGRIAQAVTV